MKVEQAKGLGMECWALLLALSVGSCTTKPEGAPRGIRAEGAAGATEMTACPVSARDATCIEVFYGTDRKGEGAGAVGKLTAYSEDGLVFGGERGEMSYGSAWVTLPKDHRLGELEQPKWYRLEFSADPAKHVVLHGVVPLERKTFLIDLHKRTKGKQAFVFVHGFNTSFEEAMMRTAQLAYDLEFDGTPIAFSWPSVGGLGVRAYVTDGNNAAWSASHLAAFLESVAARSGATKIHLVAHSMGNRVLTAALEKLAIARGGTAEPLFHEVVLAAPDIDSGVLEQLAWAVRQESHNVTLYASDNDLALKTGVDLLNTYPRAGMAGESLLILDGVETIDVSRLDTGLLGHSYVGDNSSIVSDLYRMYRQTPAHPPSLRDGIEERQRRERIYWEFVPSGAAVCPWWKFWC